MALEQIEVRLARTRDEVEQAQRLRYEVFYEECGASADEAMLGSRLDSDPYDEIMDHLLVIDHARTAAQGQVVGNYRLLPSERLGTGDQFYSSAEFDLAPLLESGLKLLELGRSCVKLEYRALPVLQMLWRGIADYGAKHRTELLFGCASLRESPVRTTRTQLALLHHAHLAPAHLRPVALKRRRVEPAVLANGHDEGRRGHRGLEPLVRGYLSAGAWVGDGGARDDAFNCVDVCIVMLTSSLTPRYQRQFQQADAAEGSAKSRRPG